jgi:hypothetical protein
MSNMTLAQIVENPMTVATDEAISNLADSGRGRLATLLRHPNGIGSLPTSMFAPEIIAAGLSDDNDALMS